MSRVDLARKDALNPQEVIEYFVLGRRKFYELIKQDGLSFIAYYGQRRLIIRTEFEKYLIEHPELRRMERGRPKKR